MTGYNSIYLDSAPIIYYLDDCAPYKAVVWKVIEDGIRRGARFFSSTLLNTEYLVLPFRLGKTEKIADFASFKSFLKLTTIYATDIITTNAARLRAKYAGLKGMDAIHLATALFTQCDMFLTNDKQLSQVTEIPVVLLDTLNDHGI